jgi:hypothetical protein
MAYFEQISSWIEMGAFPVAEVKGGGTQPNDKRELTFTADVGGLVIHETYVTSVHVL